MIFCAEFGVFLRVSPEVGLMRIEEAVDIVGPNWMVLILSVL